MLVYVPGGHNVATAVPVGQISLTAQRASTALFGVVPVSVMKPYVALTLSMAEW